MVTSSPDQPSAAARASSGPAPTSPDWPADDPLTDDALTGRVRVWQRARGHRYSLDDLLTARVAIDVARAAPRVPTRYLDLGCGLGSVLLSVGDGLVDAYGSVELHGIEAQPISLRLATMNVARTPHLAHAVLHHGDLRAPPAQLCGPFDLITGTPPYQPPGTATPSPDSQRAHARIEYRGGVEDYLARAAALLDEEAPFVVCAGGERPAERILRSAATLALRAERRLRAFARAGTPRPLFEVWTLRRGAPRATLGDVPSEDFVARDEAGTRTEAYRALRASFGLGHDHHLAQSPAERAGSPHTSDEPR